MRLENFIATDLFIEDWNAQLDKTHTVAHNFLSDWTQAERDIFSGKTYAKENKWTEKIPKKPAAIFEPDPNATPPSAWTWQTGSHVGSVQT